MRLVLLRFVDRTHPSLAKNGEDSIAAESGFGHV